MPTKPKTPDTILEALRAAQIDLGDVPKDSTNAFHKYKYTSSEQMITSCRESLHGSGLAVSEMGTELVDVAGIVAARVTYQLVHAGTGESVVWTRDFPIVPEKGRPLDKAFAGSLTTSLSYALRGLLLVPRVDPDTEMDGNARPSTPSTPSQRTKKPPARTEYRDRTEPTPNEVAEHDNDSRNRLEAFIGSADPSCPVCDSRLYDNRNDPNRGRGPLWKCSNRDCPHPGKWPWGSFDEWPEEFGAKPNGTPADQSPPPEPVDFSVPEDSIPF